MQHKLLLQIQEKKVGGVYRPVSKVHDRMLDSGDFGLALDAAGVERPDTRYQ